MAHPRLVVTAESPTFHEQTLQHWRDEGFDVSYLPFDASRKQHVEKLNYISNSLKLGESFGIVGLLTLPPVLCHALLSLS
jgi:hypothetical protein